MGGDPDRFEGKTPTSYKAKHKSASYEGFWYTLALNSPKQCRIFCSRSRFLVNEHLFDVALDYRWSDW